MNGVPSGLSWGFIGFGVFCIIGGLLTRWGPMARAQSWWFGVLDKIPVTGEMARRIWSPEWYRTDGRAAYVTFGIFLVAVGAIALLA